MNCLHIEAFLIANASGGIIWAAVFGIGGYFFGKLLLQLHHALAPIVFALALAAFFNPKTCALLFLDAGDGRKGDRSLSLASG